MRKMALVLVMVMVLTTLALPVYASAAESRAITIVPAISFDGTTATCNARIVGNTIDEELHATIRLYRGNTLVATWTAEGNGYIFFSKTKTVTKGYTYKLTVDLTVDGEACTQVYVENECE